MQSFKHQIPSIYYLFSNKSITNILFDQLILVIHLNIIPFLNLTHMAYNDFTEMPVWQKAMDIAVSIHLFTKDFPRNEDYGVT